MQYLHFVSNNLYNLHINGEYVKNCINTANNYIDLAVNKFPLYFTFTPISKENETLLPYTSSIDLINNKVVCNSEFIELIPYKNNHYDVLISPIHSAVNTLSNTIFDNYFGKVNIVILNNSSGNILVYENSKLKKQFSTNIINSAVVEEINNIFIIKCLLNNSKYYLALLKADTLSLVSEFVCDKIEQTNSEIKALIKFYDVSKTAKVYSYNYEKNTDETYNIYLEQVAKITTNKYLIPLAFLESIKNDNFNIAKTYLSNNFVTTSIEHFKNYFGNISSINFDRYNTHKNICYTIKSNNEYTQLEFEIINNQIVEIIK